MRSFWVFISFLRSGATSCHGLFKQWTCNVHFRSGLPLAVQEKLPFNAAETTENNISNNVFT
uniref:Uncharacterized protein n=1 Tax=Rhizophora mucronata TaxID=61149 RepID=A0A2P2QPM9_RHIMU